MVARQFIAWDVSKSDLVPLGGRGPCRIAFLSQLSSQDDETRAPTKQFLLWPSGPSACEVARFTEVKPQCAQPLSPPITRLVRGRLTIGQLLEGQETPFEAPQYLPSQTVVRRLPAQPAYLGRSFAQASYPKSADKRKYAQ